MELKTAIVCGAGGFIGGHLVSRLKKEGYWVRGVDIKENEYGTEADDFVVGDLRNNDLCLSLRFISLLQTWAEQVTCLRVIMMRL